jgi:thiamine-phosphate pyrophosphorylase
MALSLPPLYPIVDADLAARFGWTAEGLAEAYLRGGARLLQVRAKGAGSADFLALCDTIVALARPFGAQVVVNDRADVAVLAGADGVHVGQEDLAPEQVRRAFPALRIVGRSTHTPAQIAAAAREPVSYLAVGPVFGTVTKDTGYEAVGLHLVREARRAVGEGGEARVPVVAIGGITLERAAAVLAAGAASVAVISDLLATGDPESRVREYLERLA